MKYNIILADPPWSYSDKQKNRPGTYSRMKTKDICDLPVSPICGAEALIYPKDYGIAADNCVLSLWVTGPLLAEGLQVISAWGFKFKTIGFTWIKSRKNTDHNQLSAKTNDNFFKGMGHYTRANAELCLIGKRGKIDRKSKSISQIIYSPVREHSQKPDEIYSRIEDLYGDLPRLEMFARQSWPGWDVFGNQVENSIELC